MVKLKMRYYLVEIVPNRVERKPEFKAGELFVELIKTISDMHGDYGYAAAKGSLLVKLTDYDICLVRVETCVENLLATAIPFVTSINNTPVVLRTIFVGRSVRSCEQKLIKLRRNELYAVYGKAETGVEKKVVLDALESVTGKIH